jgi:hypothetical protein
MDFTIKHLGKNTTSRKEHMECASGINSYCLTNVREWTCDD